MTFLTIAIGLIGALSAGVAASRIAASAEWRPAAAFGACAFVVGILVYGGVLQALVLYVHPAVTLAAAVGPEAVFVGFAVAAAFAAILAGAGAIFAWVSATGANPTTAGRFKAVGFSVLFCLAVTILAAPFLIQNQLTIERSVDANQAEIDAFRMSYTSGLEKLTALGALNRIEIGETEVTHFIGDPLYKVGEQGLAEYARAAMIYHTHILGRAALPVVLRDAGTSVKIGTYRTDNVFLLHTDKLPPETSPFMPPQASATR